MLREFAHLRATRFQSNPKALGVGPTAKMAVLHAGSFARTSWNTDWQSAFRLFDAPIVIETFPGQA